MTTKNPAALLDKLLQETEERSWLEFKENNTNPKMLGECICGAANAAILAGKDKAFIVFGVRDRTKELVGTNVDLTSLKIGNEGFANWINRKLQPHIPLELIPFEHNGMKFFIVTIEPTYHMPVEFGGVRYLRVGAHVKKLSDAPESERAIWLATTRRKFEEAVALPHQTADQVLKNLDADTYFALTKEEKSDNPTEIIRKFCHYGFTTEDHEGGYNITNLGAILFATNIENFPSIASKSVRVIRYKGTDKTVSIGETEGKKGYAAGFVGLMKHIMGILPYKEEYKDGVRTKVPVYPETAIREVIANALIHQDFTISGVGPVIEIYEDRIEVINPGESVVSVERIIDERQSRNEKLANAMRHLNLCEERGGGLDKTIIAIELEKNLPAPDITSSDRSMRVTLFGPRPFSSLSKGDKLRACWFHCVSRWVKQDYMSNSSLRERFALEDDDYQVVSAIIAQAIKAGTIAPADEDQGKRNARYIPFFAVKRKGK